MLLNIISKIYYTIFREKLQSRESQTVRYKYTFWELLCIFLDEIHEFPRLVNPLLITFNARRLPRQQEEEFPS